MPALPMACLALAPLLPGIVRKLWPRRLASGFALALALVALALGAAMLFGNPGFEQRFSAERGFATGAAPMAALLVAIGAWGVGSALWFRRRPIAVLLSTLAGTWVLFGVVGYPLLNDSSSARGLMQDVGRRIGPDAQLGLVAWKEQNLLMADRPATTFGFTLPWKQQLQRGIAWQRAAPGSRWLLVQQDALSQCIARDRAVLAGRANRRLWWLVPARAVVPGCVPRGAALEGGTDVN
jgi:hypothetical protein